jgi:hypothetical protein
MSMKTGEASPFRGGRNVDAGFDEAGSSAGTRARFGMTDCRRVIVPMIVSLLLTTAITSPVRAQTCPTAPTQSPILCSYIYGYAPIAIEATRSVATAVSDASTEGFAPVNQLARSTHLPTAADKLIVRPNADVLATQAWLDLSFEPMILHLPDSGGRYYLVPMLDAYSNVFKSLGSRTTGTGAGDYAIVGPNWQGRLPSTLAGVVHAPTNMVWILGRTLVHNQADLANAVAVTSQWQLMPLTAYPQFLLTGSYIPPVNVPITPPNPRFALPPIGSGPGFSSPDFFDELLKVSLKNPPPPQQEPLAAVLVGEGVLLQSLVTQDVESQAIAAFTGENNTEQQVNGWRFNLQGGNFGDNYLLRGTIARFGIGQNIPADAVYLHTSSDINNSPLDGSKAYVIHFTPDQVPQVNGYWSITVYGPLGFLIPNPIGRHSRGSESGLVSNADGSIDILLQSTAPTTLQSNWLPTPPTPVGGKPFQFNLTMRLYEPGDAILNGTYTPPTVTPVAAAQLAGQ